VTATAEAPTDLTRLRRVWDRPLRHHAIALGLLLLALMPWLGSSRLFSSDEGALQSQAHLLSEGRGWYLDHPRPDLDPTGKWFLTYLTVNEGHKGAPFAKHPAYAVALAPLDALGGKPAMVLTSLAGTLLCALAAAGLARRVRPGIDRYAFWAVGLASPAFLYGYVLIAHTLAAALSALAVLLAIRWRGGAWAPVGLATALAVAVTLRSEALLFGFALAAACVVAAWLHRERRLVVAGVVAFAGAIAGKLLDRQLANLISSGEGTVNPVASSTDFFADRVFSATLTWLVPSYEGFGLDDLLLAGAAICGVAAVVVARRRPEDDAGIRLLGSIAVACAVARIVLPASSVPGLLVAFPLLTVGLFALDRRRVTRNAAATIATTTFVLFSLAVLATQYRDGGSGEWGGRYFLLGIPVIVPVVLAALADVGERLTVPTRRTMLGLAVGGSLALTVCSGLALHVKQWQDERGVEAIEAALDDHPDAVVVGTDGLASRYGWRHIAAGEEWLIADTPEGLEELGGKLADEGRPVVLWTIDEDESTTALTDSYEVVDRVQPNPRSPRVVLSLLPR
jgi:hypothetical protein